MLPPALDTYTEKHLRDWLGQRELDKARAYVDVVQDLEIAPEFIRAVVPGSARKPYLARTVPQLPRLVHQVLAREPAADLQVQFERLIAAQKQQSRWLAAIALLLAALIGLSLY